MPWRERVCGGFQEAPRWRLYCGACAEDANVTIWLRRGDTHTEEPCDRCGKRLTETVSAEKEHYSLGYGR